MSVPVTSHVEAISTPEQAFSGICGVLFFIRQVAAACTIGTSESRRRPAMPAADILLDHDHSADRRLPNPSMVRLVMCPDPPHSRSNGTFRVVLSPGFCSDRVFRGDRRGGGDARRRSQR